MTKIKPAYLIIGNGRVASHFAHYISLLGITCQQWWRTLPDSQLQSQLPSATHVLLLISDDAIESFAKNKLIGHPGYHIHFSGSLVSDNLIGVHPLQTFSDDLYELEQYQNISFVLDHDAPDFTELFPYFSNQHVRMNKRDKAKYHALCVLSGNFSCMLWEKFFSELENGFNIPRDIAFPYLQQQMLNLTAHAKSVMTGPLVRNDKDTIQINLKALEGDPFASVYSSFVDCYEKIKCREKI